MVSTMTEAAALLIRRRRIAGEPSDLAPTGTPGVASMRGPAGSGRVLDALRGIGVRFRTIIQLVVDPDAGAETVEALDAGRLFVHVILGSHLVNTPSDELRQAWLRAAARHLVGDCDVLIEHHPVDWAQTAADEPAVEGGTLGMVDVRREPPFVSAVSVFDVGGRLVRQPFTARVLSDTELEETLRAAGLFVRRRLSPTWLEAGPTSPRRWSVPQPPHR
jgi:hypothetical protein